MDSKWASRQLKQGLPVRRRSWGKGEHIRNEGYLAYYCAHEETYNSPCVSVSFNFTIDDVLAKDWEAVTILPCHGWVYQPYSDSSYQHFFWTKSLAIEKYGPSVVKKLKKVTKNLFSNSGKYE